MNADAYAGFLKLCLTPISKVPQMSADLEAYLQYCNEREPLSREVLRAIGSPSQRAA